MEAAAAKRRVALARLLPCGVIVVAALWLLPLWSRTTQAQGLDAYVVGNWVVLAIVLVWTSSLALIVASLERGGRNAGRVWTTVQVLLLATVVVWALPPLLLAGPGVVENDLSWIAQFLLPVVAIVLSAVQGLILFLRA